MLALPEEVCAVGEYEHVGSGIDEYGAYIEFKNYFFKISSVCDASKSGTNRLDVKVLGSDNWEEIVTIDEEDSYNPNPINNNGNCTFRTQFGNLNRFFSRVRTEKGEWKVAEWGSSKHTFYNDKGCNKEFYAYVRIYLPEDLLGKPLEYRRVETYNNNTSSIGQFTVKHPINDSSFSLKEEAYESGKPGYTLIKYDSFLAEYNDYDKASIDVTCGTELELKGQADIDSTRSYYYKLTNTAHPFKVKMTMTYEGGRKYSKEHSFTPLYHIQADNFNAVYDSNKGEVEITWSVPAIEANRSKYKDDQFEIEYALKSDFSDAKRLDFIDYDVSKTSDTINHHVSSISDKSSIYYRIRRTSTADIWGWNVCQTKSIPLSITNHLYVDKAWVTADNATAEATVKIQLGGYFVSEGSTFILERTNRTNATTRSYEFDIDTLQNGDIFTFIDDELIACNYFSYTAYIKPGKKPFTVRKVKASPENGVIITDIGSLSELKASKGYYHDRVTLDWKSEGAFDEFIIQRVPYVGGDTIFVGSVSASTSGTYTADDTKAIAGTYYTYLVYGTVKCGKDIFKSKEIQTSVGFRSPKGEIYGRIAFESGQGVDGVTVNLEGQDLSLGTSVQLPVVNGALYVPKTKEAISNDEFTFETWFKPLHHTDKPTSQVLFSKEGQYLIGFNALGEVYMKYSDGAEVSANYPYSGEFVHLTATYKTGPGSESGSVQIYINDSLCVEAPANATIQGDKTNPGFYLGSRGDTDKFDGYLDEVRIWNKALRQDEIAVSYNRLITGNEKGLIAYYRFDEITRDEFYDASYSKNIYNANHGGIIADNGQQDLLINRSDRIPSSSQLGLKGFTDESGNYYINNIPYEGNGTQYTILPSKGGSSPHRFEPVQAYRNISAGSLSHAVDFTDKSSFTVSGHVYYVNTDVPVSGVSFKINGTDATILGSSGSYELVKSDENGYYEINVPIGENKVVPYLNNHILSDPFSVDGKDRNYQQNLLGVMDIWDSTTVRVIGRIAGGAIQDSIPVGFSASKNNLGSVPMIKLTLTNAEIQGRYLSDTEKTDTVYHLIPAGCEDRGYHTKAVYKGKNENNIETGSVYIYPDSITGEFFVDLIPEPFEIRTAKAGDYSLLTDPDKFDVLNLSDNSIFTVQKNEFEYGVYNGTDTLLYSDSVSYNLEKKFIKRVMPTLTVTQVDGKGLPVKFFGESDVEINRKKTINGELTIVQDTIPLFNEEGEAIFGTSMFKQAGSYTFMITSSEAYLYNGDASKSDYVPTADGTINISNPLRIPYESDPSSASDILALNEKGQALYTFTGGEPTISDKLDLLKKQISISMKYGESATPIVYDKTIEGVLLGTSTTGSKFTTKGPNKLLTVLRDPPGSKSYSYMESGSVITTVNERMHYNTQEGENSFVLKHGLMVQLNVGTPFFSTTTLTQLDNSIGAKVKHQEEWKFGRVNTSTTTLNETIETSSDPMYVGRDADLLIGKSTNIVFGLSNGINIIHKDDYVESSDENVGSLIIAEGGDYYLTQGTGLNVGTEFSTIFALTQLNIETKKIPDLISNRNNIFYKEAYGKEMLSSVRSQLQQEANTTGKQVVYSYLYPTDPRFGASNCDSEVFPGVEDGFIQDGESYVIFYPEGKVPVVNPDTIFAFNESIRNWHRLLEENEKAKLNATELLANYSFDAGAKRSYSREYSYEHQDVSNYSFMVGGGLLIENGLTINKAGFKLTVDEGYSHSEDYFDTTINESTRKDGFVLEEDGDDDELSVDVYYEKSPNYDALTPSGSNYKDYKGPFVFRTRAGITSCPYEGARYTKYYTESGKYMLLDEATLMVEKPTLSVVVDSVKYNRIVTNVPASRKAIFKLRLGNQSDAKEDVWYTLNVLDASNKLGAKLSVDGLPLGGNGRPFLVRYGEVLEKTLEVAKGEGDAMDYENIVLVLHSQCQYDPTNGLFDDIYDSDSISVHFIPSCSDIQVKYPLNNSVVNTLSFDGQDYLLPVELDSYDINTGSLHRIELQAKRAEATSYSTLRTFYKNKDALEGNGKLIDKSQATIKDTLFINNDKILQGNYDLRAVSYCRENGQDVAKTESDIVRFIVDTKPPVLFGSLQPANGILGINDQVMLTFNEDINENAVSGIKVTGILNGSAVDNSVSIALDGVNDYVSSEMERNFTGKSLSIQMKVRANTRAGAGTLFSQGNANESLEFGIDANRFFRLQLGETVIVSQKTLPAFDGSSFIDVAVVYNAALKTVSAYYGDAEVIPATDVAGEYTATGIIEIGRSIGKGGEYFHGNIGEVRVWSKAIPVNDLKLLASKTLSGSESGLIAYYPMTEGKGSLIADKARGANAQLFGEWTTPEGRALYFDRSMLTIPASTAQVETRNEEDYSIELWFKAEPGQTNATLITNAKLQEASPDLSFDNNIFYLGFDGAGKLSFRSADKEVSIENVSGYDYRDNNWHSFALSVNHNTQYSEVYIDGELINQFSTVGIGRISSDSISLGAVPVVGAFDKIVATDRHFKGSIDEVRIWNAALTKELFNANGNTRLSGSEIGLLAYYPFEKHNGIDIQDALEDMSSQTAEGGFMHSAKAEPNLIFTDNAAPIKNQGFVSNILVEPIVSDRSIILNIPYNNEIEKTTLTFSVPSRCIQDKHGNNMGSSLVWSAFVDRNLLKWADNELNITKPEFVSYQFAVDLINNGGNTERFTLENLPVWLNASPASGAIEPKGKQRITFEIEEGLNVGRYDEVVYVRNSNNVSEALTVNLKVEGERPDWSVNPADHDQNMIVYGQLRVNGIFSSDKEDLLAAFINNECVGVVNNAYLQKANVWYAFLTVYGNKNLIGQEVEFRIWDASTGKTFAATTSQTINFRNQDVYGSANTPLIFDTQELQYHHYKLNRGWNWISFNLTSDRLHDVQYTLGRGWNKEDLIKNENYQASYSAANQTWVKQNALSLNNTNMYLLKTATNKKFSVLGRPVDLKTTSIPVISNEWNYISYLPTVNMRIDEALAGYDAAVGDILKSQDKFSMYSGSQWVGSLVYLEPGKGYILYREKDQVNTSFIYPSRTMLNSVRGSSTLKTASYAAAFANNMTIVACITDPVDLRKGDVIVATINGEVRGECEVKDAADLFFINVSSDDAGIVDFSIRRNGEFIVSSNTKVLYEVNRQQGTLSKPLNIRFSEGLDPISVYPNPVVDQLNITVSLDERSELEVSVYSTGGQLVKRFENQSFEAGTHTLKWLVRDIQQISNAFYLVEVKVNGLPSTYKVQIQ